MRAVGLFSIALIGALGGCATPGEIVADQEGLLAAAGFIARPADTPERAASLQRLPPGRVVQEAQGDQFTYVFADPLVCNCLYAGDAAAYGRYQQELFQRNLVNTRVYAAELDQQAAFNWGAWGPFGFRGPRYF